MTRLKIIGVYLATLFAAHMLDAAIPSTDEGDTTVAIDANGKAYSRSELRRVALPEDCVFQPVPDYPVEDRARHHEGRAVLDLTLDLTTGRVTSIKLVKSSGFPSLDHSAERELARWRWKPGKWKEIVMPVTFEMKGRSSASPYTPMFRPSLGGT